MARSDDDQLVWLDLEMTGLDVEHDTIVEVACIVTDSRLDPLDDGIDLVVHQDADVLERMDHYVRRMHTRSGLLALVETSETSLSDAEDRTLEYVRKHVSAPGTAPLCGNSIGTDRRFLDRYMNGLENFLHYRSIDVSSIKELCRRWYPDIYAKRPGKAEQHRALDDVKESIEELRFYRDELFKASPAAAAPSPPGR
jgi:oligoribonuclease